MDVKGIGNNTNYVPLQEVKKQQTQPVDMEVNKAQQDKLEISSQAKVLNQQNEQPKDLTAVQQKIDNDFYNNDDVIKATVSSLMREFNFA